MKKVIFAMALVAVMSFGFASCNTNKEDSNVNDSIEMVNDSASTTDSITDSVAVEDTIVL